MYHHSAFSIPKPLSAHFNTTCRQQNTHATNHTRARITELLAFGNQLPSQAANAAASIPLRLFVKRPAILSHQLFISSVPPTSCSLTTYNYFIILATALPPLQKVTATLAFQPLHPMDLAKAAAERTAAWVKDNPKQSIAIAGPLLVSVAPAVIIAPVLGTLGFTAGGVAAGE